VGREKLSDKIAERARKDLDGFGIELIDVQLMRVAYNATVEAQVYNRMKAEQDQIAGKIRSLGRGEQEAIKGKLERDLKEIESQAYRKVEEMKGGADAEAMRIYAKAIGTNEEFYEFLRTAQAYRAGLRQDTKLILSADNEFLKLLNEGTRSMKR
jgi:membrane protease subunit HflC